MKAFFFSPALVCPDLDGRTLYPVLSHRGARAAAANAYVLAAVLEHYRVVELLGCGERSVDPVEAVSVGGGPGGPHGWGGGWVSDPTRLPLSNWRGE